MKSLYRLRLSSYFLCGYLGIFLNTCFITIQQTAVHFPNPECDNSIYDISSVEFISINPENNKNNYIKEYNEIITKYIESKTFKRESIEKNLQSQTKLKLNLKITSDLNPYLDFLSFLTLYIIPYSIDATYELSGSITNKDNKESNLKTASMKIKQIRFFPLFIVDAIDNDRVMPGRTHRILIDSFLERNLLVCKQQDI